MHLEASVSVNLKNDITATLRLRSTPKSPKSTPDLHRPNDVRGGSYVNLQHIKMPKHFLYIPCGCGMHLEASVNLKNDITASLRLRSTHKSPKPPKSTPDLHRPNNVREGSYVNPQHIKMPKHFLYISSGSRM
jgi:hypothetical protein